MRKSNTPAYAAGLWIRWRPAWRERGRALFLDTRTLERRLVPLPPASAVLVLDSGVARTLAGSGYNERRAECEEAARRLGVSSLRDVHDILEADTLPEPLRRRVRHVVSENARVLLAADCTNAKEFGVLMNASHASLRDDYEVSIPELDRLVALLQAHPNVYGARLTGAGFGGACVALCKPEGLQAAARKVLHQYSAQGLTAARWCRLGIRQSDNRGPRLSNSSTNSPQLYLR